jgi:hypothetical protein
MEQKDQQETEKEGKQIELTKEDMLALSNIDLEFQTGMQPPDVSHKLADILKNPELLPQYTDLSTNEVKKLTKIMALAEYFDDDVSRAVVKYFVMYKKSNKRTSLTRLEEMIISRAQATMGTMQRIAEMMKRPLARG